MIRLFLSLTYQQHTELKEHFHSNGCHVIWETYDVITADEDEVDYIRTILTDNGIHWEE